MPPIYQPEVAARAVVRAADRPKRREHWVGASTVGTLLGDKLPAELRHQLLDRELVDEQPPLEPAPATTTSAFSPR